MKLKSITVGGFKNIARTKLLLDRVIAVVSPNNYGKSNLLEAIDFGTDFITASPKQRQLMMGWVRGIPINSYLANEDFTFEIEFHDPELGEYQYVKYGYRFSWYKDNGTGQRIIDEWLETRPNESVRYTAFLKRPEGKYRKSKDTSAYRIINADNNQLIIEMLAAVQDISIYPVLQSIRRIDYHVCASLDLGDRFQSAPIEYIKQADEGGVMFDDDDVPRALYQLKQLNPNYYDLFEEAAYTLFPEIKAISVQSFELKKEDGHLEHYEYVNGKKVPINDNGADDRIPFRIRDEIYRLLVTSRYLNQPINMSMMSTGTKRIFWLLANVFIATAKCISCIGVEELETSIHPKLLKSLLEILDEILEDNSLIISSHSPYLIQYIKPERIYVGVPNDHGTAVFKRIKHASIRSLISASRDNGMSVGEYLFELMASDQDNSEILSLYLED